MNSRGADRRKDNRELQLVIADADLVGDLLMHLIAQIDRGNHQILYGLSSEQLNSVDKLTKLLAKDVIKLVNSVPIKIVAHVDVGSLTKALNKLDVHGDEMQDLTYFIDHSATKSMLNHLFDTPEDVINVYRKILNVSPRSGRVPLPDPNIREAIQAHWHSETKSRLPNDKKVLRSLLRSTHIKFKDVVSLDMLYATINEFKE